MERRQMLHYLLSGGLTFGVGVPLFAQEGQPRPKTRPVSAPAQNAHPAGNAPAMTPQQQQELDRVLLDWEKKTAIITKLRGEHYRYEYDSVFLVEKRAKGEFWYEAPDKGRIDFNDKETASLDSPPPKSGPNDQPYQVQLEPPSIWSCDGANIWQLNITDKSYDQIQIPLHARGENIMDGPLPFLFGMKAEKAKQRYMMTLGARHNTKDRDGRTIYHIVAKPTLADDASNWSQAEAMLDSQYCLPKAIRLLDPAGSTETVYVFPLEKMHANEKRWIWSRDPFKPDLGGFRLLHSGVKEPEEHKRTGGILPVRGTD
jgi:TIGR03009 family protein